MPRMPDSSHPIPKKRGNSGLIIVAALMLLAALGLVIYKLKSSSKSEVVEERVTAPKAPEPAPAVLDNAPPPPPSEEEVAPEQAPQESAKDQKASKGPLGPPGCSGQCVGTAGDDLRAALAARAASARSCYNTALRRNSTLEGKMTVNVRVSPKGSVCSAGVSNNTLGDAAVASCVSAQFRSSQFPAPAGGCVDTAVPLNFTAPK